MNSGGGGERLSAHESAYGIGSREKLLVPRCSTFYSAYGRGGRLQGGNPNEQRMKKERRRREESGRGRGEMDRGRQRNRDGRGGRGDI